MTRDEVLKYLTNLADEYTSALEAIEGSGSKLVDVYGERVKALSAAAEVLELVAWAEEQNALIGCSKHGAFVGWGNGRKLSGDTLIDTLRRAREAAR